MLREPSAASSRRRRRTTPTSWCMQYLERERRRRPRARRRAARTLLDRGYKLLTGYETRRRATSGSAATRPRGAHRLRPHGVRRHEAKVYGDVDGAMVARTARLAEVAARRQGRLPAQRRGARLVRPRAPEVTNAYITWALDRGRRDGPRQGDREAREARRDDEGPVPAGARRRHAAATHRRRSSRRRPDWRPRRSWRGMQDSDGAWTNADHSHHPQRRRRNLEIETTSLAIARAAQGRTATTDEARKRHRVAATSNRGGYGQWGATQATVLALKALTAYADATRATPHAGRREPRRQRRDGGASSASRPAAATRSSSTTSATRSRPARTRIELQSTDGDPLPYSARGRVPLPRAGISHRGGGRPSTRRSRRASVKMGETVRLAPTISNKTARASR